MFIPLPLSILLTYGLLSVEPVAAAPGDGDLDYTEVITVTGEPEAVAPVANVREESQPAIVQAIEEPTFGRVLQQLAAISGLSLVSMGPGQRQTLSLRGSSAQQLLLAYNGIPLNSPLGGGADLSLFMLDNLDNVAVQLGVDSTSGEGATAGKVELFGHDLLDKELQSGAFLRLSGGSMNSWSLNGLGRYLWKKGGAELSLGARRSDGQFAYLDDNGSRRIRQNNDSRQFGGTLALAQKLKGQDRLSLLAHTTASQRGIAGPYQMESFSARQNDIKSFLGIHGQLFAKTNWRPEVQFDGLLRYERLHFIDPTPPYESPIDELSQVLMASLSGEVAFSPHVSQRLGVGAELGVEQFWQNKNDQTRLAYRLTIFDHMTWCTERLLLDLTLSFVGKGEQYLFLPAAGGRWRFISNKKNIKEFSLFIHGGRGGRFPSFYELFSHQDGVIPNKDLKEEAVWEISGGLFLSHEHMKARLALFHRWQNNMILFVPLTANLIQAQNFSKSRAYGLEAQVTGHWYVDWQLSYTWTRTAWGDGGSLQLPGHPEHQGGAKIAYNIKVYEWRKNSRAVHLIPWSQILLQNKMALDSLNNLWEEGRVLLNLGLDSRFPFDLRFSFWVENLLDKKDAVDSLQYPLNGRTYWFCISGSWQPLQ